MALRDQPYLPLYIQDFLTDEKLNECSASTTGVYVKLMCLMHKSDDYGKLLLKQKYKISQSKESDFALMISRVLPFSYDEVLSAIKELISEKVLHVDGDFLCQKRMIKDNNLSDIRRKSGQKGGNAAPTKSHNKPGYIYLISDKKKHKIGLSTDPDKRVLSLRSKYKLSYLSLIDSFEVADMGAAEDNVMAHFKDCIDGEWLICDYDHAVNEFSTIKKTFIKPKATTKAKSKANAENEIVNENAIESVVESTENPEMVFLFERWVKYKAERKEGYKSAESLRVTFEKLKRQSGNDTAVAKIMIDDAIGSSWKGFFEPKKDNRPLDQPTSNRGASEVIKAFSQTTMNQ